jgi:Flp pilus assembly protein TadG
MNTVADRPKGPPNRRGRRSSRGQSIVEFALIAPLLLITVFGIIDFAMGLRAWVSLTNATRDGARYGSVGNPLGSAVTSCVGEDDATVVGRVCTVAEGLDKAEMTVDPSCDPDCDPGSSVRVEATYEYHFITPMGDLLNFVSGGSFPETLDLSTSTDMRLE